MTDKIQKILNDLDETIFDAFIKISEEISNDIDKNLAIPTQDRIHTILDKFEKELFMRINK